MNIPFRRAAVLATAVSLAVSEIALAQIATDGTLGPAGALAGPNYAITANLGRQVGANLFHSFSTFNLTNGQSATFSGPASIAHIINRVTGGSASNIDGLLRSTIAGANLYLINPSGILFGQNASLDLTGSFHASTANYIKLADGGRFDATTPAASVLTTAPPAAFGFLGPGAAPITVQGASLSVPEGAGVSLVGGAVTLSDTTLRTVAGDIRLIGMAGAGEVALNATGASPSAMPLAPITIERSTLATENGSAMAPGRIVIRGGQITLADSNIASVNSGSYDAPAVSIAAAADLNVIHSGVASEARSAGAGADLLLSGERISLAQTTEVRSEASSSGRGGDIRLSAVDSLRLASTVNDPYYSELISRAGAGGPAGAITAVADSILIQSSNIFTETRGSADAAPITLTGRSVDITDGTWVFSQAWPGTTGRGADIALSGTQRVFVGGVDWGGFAASVFTEAFGSGNAGNVRVSAPEIGVTGGSLYSKTYGAGNSGSLRFDGETVRFRGGNGTIAFIDTTAWGGSSGNGGDIEIHASREFELNSAEFPQGWTRISSSAFSSGRGGSIAVEAPSITVAHGASIWTQATDAGNGGGITLRGGSVVVRDGGEVHTHTSGSGDAGRITIAGANTRVDHAIVDSYTIGSGTAGDINFAAPSITLQGSLVLNITYADGNAGSLRFEGDVIRFVAGPSAEVRVDSGSSISTTGNGGNIEIRATREFELNGSAAPLLFHRVAATTQGTGRGGDLIIEAPSILIDKATVFSRTRFGTGDQGGITLRANEIRLRNGGEIASGTEGERKGSFILIEASSLEASDYSRIFANTIGSGDAGRITVNAQRVLLTGASSIQVNSGHGTGNAGDMVLNIGESLEISRRNVVNSFFTFAPVEAVWPGGLLSQAAGSGNAGSVVVRAPTILLDDGRILTTALQSGQGGRVEIHADNLTMRNGAQVDARSALGSSGDAGSINIAVAERFEISGLSPIDGAFSGLYAETQGSGRGGNIGIGAGALIVDRGLIRSSAGSSGNAGKIGIRAGDVVLANGGWIDAGTSAGSSGAGGSIEVAATRSLVVGGIDPNARSPSLLETQQLNITPGTSGRAQGPFPSTISSSTAGAGAGGAVTLSAAQLAIEDGGRVSANSSGAGDAGNISVRAAELLKVNGGSITTQAATSAGGDVKLKAPQITIGAGAQVSANSSGPGRAGTILIDAPQWLTLSGSSITTQAAMGAGGNVTLDSPRISIDAGSAISANSSGEGNAGNILVRAPEWLRLDASSITTQAAIGAGGDVTLKAPQVTIGAGAQVSANSSGPGRAGTILIDAPQWLTLSGSSITTQAAMGAGGNITVHSPQITIDAGSAISANSSGEGNAGNILVRAPEWLRLEASSITTQAELGAGGDVTLKAPQITIGAAAQVSANSSGPGRAGTILIDAPQWLTLSGSSITTQAAMGAGGNVTLDSPRISIDAGSAISANSSGEGNAGNIFVRAPDWLRLEASSITTQAELGAGGDVTLKAPQITIGAAAQVSANSSGPGRAGTILIDAPQWFNLHGGSVTTQAAMGAGGNITVHSPQITIDAGGQVSANSTGAGDAGNILVHAPDWLKISGGSITTQAASGDGGNIVILAGNRVHLQNAEISTSVGSGEGSGGNIFIDPTFVILESSRITANAFGGAGGNINIITDHLLASPDSVIDASSRLGISGSVQIAGLRTNPNAALAQLPSALFDASALLREACAGRAGPRASSLVGVGRGGVADAPEGFSASRYFTDTSLPLAAAGGAATLSSAGNATATPPSVLLSAICGRSA